MANVLMSYQWFDNEVILLDAPAFGQGGDQGIYYIVSHNNTVLIEIT